MELKSSKTFDNLRDAFIGESKARSRYIFYAEFARANNAVSVANAFEDAARNEQEHAKIWFKLLGGLSDNTLHIKEAISSESYEATKMYIEFAKTAREEGFEEIAILFDAVAKIESEHEKKFSELLGRGRAEHLSWQCPKCGYKHDKVNAPKNCPVCEQYRVGGVN